jgi:hypothetical protein
MKHHQTEDPTIHCLTGRPALGGARAVLSLLLLLAFQASLNAQSAPDSVPCAKEGERCYFIGTGEVSYGAGDKWITKTATKQIDCGVAAFGSDPAPNVLKTCKLVPTKCADEGGLCKFTGTRVVKYGANGTWATIASSDGVSCGVAAFGRDPVPNVLKQCYLSAPVEKPINQVTWLGTHNAISSPHYGYVTQASQRDSVTAQLDRGARLLEIDIVHDTPPGYAEGVYICHCGNAPHSNSLGEINRLLIQPGTMFPFELAGWTHGTPYMRFSTVLKEIDQWLIANPNEIAIVLIENNGATAAQFNAEVEFAGLRTAIYKKPAGQPWAAKSELGRTGRRLIFLSGQETGNNASLDSSNYVNPIGLSIFGGNIAPAAYGKNEYAGYRGTRDGDKFVGVGVFNSKLTTELTAPEYNNYAFLSSQRAEWTAKGVTRQPTYVQVNQVHLGDALRFVNDLNGPGYLVSSKVENVGQRTADSWQIRFQNEAAFNAGLEVIYFEDQLIAGTTLTMPKALSTEVTNILVGTVRMINMPAKLSPGKPVYVSVKLYSTQTFELWKGEIPAGFAGSPQPCFKATGILTSPKGGRCE